jgi:hypothetical protein
VPDARETIKYRMSPSFWKNSCSESVKFWRCYKLGIKAFAKVSNVFFPLFPSHHIKYVKRHTFGVLNIGKNN